MSLINTYYLLDGRFGIFDKGSILNFDGKKLINLEYMSIEINGSISSDWIPVEKNEAFFLSRKDALQRKELLRRKKFDEIKSLKTGENCFYNVNQSKRTCQIVSKSEEGDGVYFKVKDDESDAEVTVPAGDIVLPHQDAQMVTENRYCLQSEEDKNIECHSLPAFSAGEGNIYIGDASCGLNDAIPEDIKSVSLPISVDKSMRLHDREKDELMVLSQNINKDFNKSVVDSQEKSKNISSIILQPNEPLVTTIEYIEKLWKMFEKNPDKKFSKFINDGFFNWIKSNFFDYRSDISVSKCKECLYDDIALLHVRMLCRNIQGNTTGVTKIRTYPGLLAEIDELFIVLSKKTKLSPKEEDILLNIILIYFHILKDSNCINRRITEIFEECFKSRNVDQRIKIGSALCLSFAVGSSCPLLGEIHHFLKEVALKDNMDIFFQRSDILMALGSISSKVTFDDLLLGGLIDCLNELKNSINLSNNLNVSINIHDKLKFILGQLPKLNEEALAIFEEEQLIHITKRFLEIILEKSVKTSNNQLKLDCAMTVLSIVCDLCDASTHFVNTIIGSQAFMLVLKAVFNQVVELNVPSDKEFLEVIIFIYFNLLKSGEKIKNLPSLPKMVYCFNNSKVNNQIKTAAALNLCFMNSQKSDVINAVEAYLKHVCETSHSSDVYGFSKSEICLALERIGYMSTPNVLKCSVDKNLSSSETLQSTDDRKSELVAESMYQLDRPSSEEYEKCLSLTTEDITSLTYEDRIECLNVSLKMNDIGILSNLLRCPIDPIDLAANPEILKYVIDRNDPGVVKILLNNCVTSPELYEQLLRLAEDSTVDVAELVSSKINLEDVSPEFNRKLLSFTFSLLSSKQEDLFKRFMALSPDREVLMDEDDTFLTRMVKESSADQMKVAMDAFRFEVNTKDRCETAPICTACKVKDADKIRLLRVQKDQTIDKDDFQDATAIVYELYRTEKDMFKKLKDALEETFFCN